MSSSTNAFSDNAIYQERMNWLDKANTKAKGEKYSAYMISPLSYLLLVDIELAFCAGAWTAVIMLSDSAIECTLRQIHTNDYASKSSVLFRDDPDLQWLRNLRNDLVHIGKPGSKSLVWKIGGGDIAANHAALEEDAKKAIPLVYGMIYREQKPLE